ncbi:glycosyltransferase family 4 protein [Clostridium amazonitimonense]|uniref:glycosyltransferase family 4 protein n=1 Tax=Clostridium amazonitimonense TaxID=1499689 RepID=UPI0005097A30|nr:glycosyltransferase family 4 protein [Clostridium amazonitimonense]
MNVLFVGVRWQNEEDITSGPQKIGNILYNRLTKDEDNFYFYGLCLEDTKERRVDFEIINKREARGDMKHLSSYIKENNIKVLYIARYYSSLALYAVYLSAKHKLKIVYTVHGLVKKERVINGSFKAHHVLCEDLLLKRAHKIVAVSEDLKSEILKYYPALSKEKIEVINNGVSIIPIKEKIDIKNTYHLEEDKKILFTVGVRKIKNIEVILENFVKNKSLYEKSYLLVAGENDTDYAKEIINKYKEYKNIRFIGYVDTNMMNNIYSEMDIFIQISKFETFGMSIVESLLHKKPVIISSLLPIAKYFNEEEVCMYNYKEDDLATLMLEILNKNSINEKGYKKAVELFDWDKVKDNYHEVFMKF